MWFKELIKQSFYKKRWGILSLYLVLAIILGIGWFIISDRIAGWANDQIDERMPMTMNWLFGFLSSDIFSIIAWLLLVVFAVIGFVILYKRAEQSSPLTKVSNSVARRDLSQSDSEVDGVIRLLQTESLVAKHNNGEKRSYSFAQVLLAIADQLSIGISSILFESNIKKGFDIDEGGDWYFPYDDEGITHLIGMLVQNALVERRNEEYQHMTREVVSGATGIYLTPDAHLIKNTEVKYYLSPFGASVVKQLRQQLTVHNEGSQSLGGGIEPIVISKEEKVDLKIELQSCVSLRWIPVRAGSLDFSMDTLEATVKLSPASSIKLDSLILHIGRHSIKANHLPVGTLESENTYKIGFEVSNEIVTVALKRRIQVYIEAISGSQSRRSNDCGLSIGAEGI